MNPSSDSPAIVPSRARRLFSLARCTLVVTGLAALFNPLPAVAQPAPVEYYQLAHGFLPEVKLADGRVQLPAFATPNPWGFYTAYLMSTNAKGQRTWRIENFLPGPTSSQGSSMYLLEGSQRALLIDTAQNTKDEPGKDDLKTLVRHLLAHTNTGEPKPNPVDFVVANTHSHGDHTGKNSLMSDRTLYYPEGDWPANAPSNWVPIKEGGGPGPHGESTGKIDLGGRVIEAVAMYAHTPGSTGYLDRENEMLSTGDALGSAFVWAHFAFLSQYAASAHHVVETVKAYPRITVLPAHFFQNSSNGRRLPPVNGRPVDFQYIVDQTLVADGVLDGSVFAEAYSVGRGIAWAGVGSARVCFSLTRLSPEGQKAYIAVRIPGLTPAVPDVLKNIQAGLYLIRGLAGESIYLVIGSNKALLIGTGAGAPGLSALVTRLIGSLPLDVVVTSDDRDQIGGLAQFLDRAIYLPKGANIPTTGLRRASTIGAGDRIQLGTDLANRPLELTVHPLAGHSATGITLLDVADRILFSGHALGQQTTDGGLMLNDTLQNFSTALTQWRAQTDGKYDLVYTATNPEWMTAATFVDQVQDAVNRGLKDGDAAMYNSIRPAGMRMIRSTRVDDSAASIVIAGTKAIPGGDAPPVNPGRGGRGPGGPGAGGPGRKGG